MGRVLSHLLPRGSTSHFAHPFIALIIFLPDGEGLPELLVSSRERGRTDAKSAPAKAGCASCAHHGICGEGL
jgi:hypothetical protein